MENYLTDKLMEGIDSYMQVCGSVGSYSSYLDCNTRCIICSKLSKIKKYIKCGDLTYGDIIDLLYTCEDSVIVCETKEYLDSVSCCYSHNNRGVAEHSEEIDNILFFEEFDKNLSLEMNLILYFLSVGELKFKYSEEELSLINYWFNANNQLLVCS